MNKKQRKEVVRVAIALVLFAIVMILPLDSWLETPYNLYAEFLLFLIPYLIAGYKVLFTAVKSIFRGNPLDENFLMAVASIGAFSMVFFPESDPHMAEGAAVMIFYQVGELFESFAVNRSRKSIKSMMEIAPEFANIMQGGELVQVDPYDVQPGDEIVIKPGERVPLDGFVISGDSQIDTAALTGESLPRSVHDGDEVVSGCINLTGMLTVRVSKAFEDSTVSRILELVENAAEKKARTENFITRFARVYTPIVVVCAVVLAIVPPLAFGGAWNDWIFRALCFLVVSCPCALVISVPMSFFGGIGGASKLGILIKGSNYMETLAHVDTVVFDKTGTLTTGTFEVTDVKPASGFAIDKVIELAAYAEEFSNHPIASSVKKAYGKPIDASRIEGSGETSGHGVHALIDGKKVHVGNMKLMASIDVEPVFVSSSATVLHVAVDGVYAGSIEVSDVVKENAAVAIEELKRCGVSQTIMLTGDREEVAANVADKLGLTGHASQLLPQDKVAKLEELLAGQQASSKLAFVGDGINDAPVLMRADVGIAMGAMGSDAAIEAADIVLMDDDPKSIARSIRLSKKTMRIVWQNIIFAIGVKVIILALAAFGIATMWLAVFGDVGVSVIAIMNAMRAMRVNGLR